MKKRIACLLLTLVMLVSLIPTAAITASAASGSVSAAGIKVIKDYKGFQKNAYKVGETFLIGYGTPSVENAVITEANADLALREVLAQLDAAINAKVSATLVQKRHDALVWYCFVEGTKCLDNAMFLNAINSGATGSELVNAMCTWSFQGKKGYPDDDASKAVMERRLAMANLYLNGVYSPVNTSSFGYTVFDAGEGAFASGAKKAVQAFDGRQMTTINVAEPVNGTKKFTGWHTVANNAYALVTGVGTATAGTTLVACWQDGEDKVSTLYSLPAYVIYQASGTADNAMVDVYASTDLSSKKIDVVKRDDVVSVVSEKISGGDKWLELSTGGWVRLCTVGTTLPTVISSVTVTVTDDYVNIRKEPSVASEKLGVAKRGQTKVIVMTVANDTWGYCSDGWIYLAYTDYNDKTAGSNAGSVSGYGAPAVVTGADRVNVRAAAGVRNQLVTTLANGTAISVYERTTVDGAEWGHIDQGWISMNYVKVNETSSPAASAAVSGTKVTVSGTVSLNVRTGPGTEYAKVATLTPGSTVTILRKETVKGVAWALIDKGWINMNYVTIAGTSVSGSAAVAANATVVNCSSGVNIRSAAGTTNALVGVAPVNSRVTVSETTTVNGFRWGHIERGWVCMDYIQLDAGYTEPTQNNNSAVELNNVVAASAGYPAVTNTSAVLRESASSDAKAVLTLNSNVSVMIVGRVAVGTKEFGKVKVGDISGWVDMSEVTLSQVNAKVTAERANTYEEPSTRSKFYAALPKGSTVVIGDGTNNSWKLDGNVLWGKTTVVANGVEHTAWISMADVAMFVYNTLPEGISTSSGVGYLTGSINNATVVYYDDHGAVTTNPTDYTLVAGHKVNILGRNYVNGTTWGKVMIGDVIGWINMADVTLNSIQMQATANINGYASLSDVNVTSSIVIPMGSKLTVLTRAIVPYSNSLNNGINDCGYVYVGDNADVKYWVILDEGKVNPISAAVENTVITPDVQAGVVIPAWATAGVNIYEEAVSGSKVLMQLNSGSRLNILNWKLFNGMTWGKVQVGNVVGWVQIDGSVSFNGLYALISTEGLNVYAKPDVASSVQVYRLSGRVVSIDPNLVFDGTTLWGKISVSDKEGWVDLKTVIVTESAPSSGSAIVTGKINSVEMNNRVYKDAAFTELGSVSSLPKGTAVNLVAVQMVNGEAHWKVDLGGQSGWIAMDTVSLNPAVARVIDSRMDIYEDLVSSSVLYTLYRDETVNIMSFMARGGVLFGEVGLNNTTGWIVLCDASGMHVSLTPGSNGSNINTNPGNSTAPTEPAAPTTPAATEPIPGYIVCSTTVNVRSAAGVGNTLVTTLPNATAVKIYEQTSVNGVTWARIEQGWVCMDYVRLGTLTGNTTGNAGNTGSSGSVSIMTTVPAGAIAVGYTNEKVSIRTNPGLGYPEVATAAKGSNLVIYEKKLDGGMSWGRTDQGWVCISYMTITGIGTSGSGTMGTIGRCAFTANVRNTANSGGALMAKVMITSRVAVHETMVVGNETWARTDLGWINAQYVVMDSETVPVPTPDANTNTNAPAAQEPVYDYNDNTVG